MNSARSSISQWQSDHHLETVAQNSEALVDALRGNIKKPPPILLQGTVVTPSSTLWYPGMHLDGGLTSRQYINGFLLADVQHVKTLGKQRIVSYIYT